MKMCRGLAGAARSLEGGAGPYFALPPAVEKALLQEWSELMQDHFLSAFLAFATYSVTVGRCCGAALTVVLSDGQILLPAYLFVDEL